MRGSNSMATATKTRKPRANSKSGAVRAYFARHPQAGPTEVANALKKEGIEISAAHVSNVKAAMKRKAGSNGQAARGRGRRGRPAAGGSDAVSISSLIEARSFANRVGGVEKASALIAALAKLQS
jgi:hypothetical protein